MSAMPEGNMAEIPAGNDVIMRGESAEENADFHTASESVEGVSRGENSPDHTVLNIGQETKEVVESNAEKNAATDAVILQENAAMDAAIKQIPQSKLEEIAGWFLYFAAQEGILNYCTIADGNTWEIMNRISQRFQEMKQAEEMCVVLEAQMVGLQNHAEELLAQKDDDAQQEIEQLRAECRDVLAEQQADAEKANAKMKQKLRDSGGYVVELLEKIRQLEAEVQEMKFADSKSEHDRTVESEDELKKFRKSLGGGAVDRKNAKDMAMAFRLSTNVMPTRVHRDKELTESFQSIQNATEKLNLTKESG